MEIQKQKECLFRIAISFLYVKNLFQLYYRDYRVIALNVSYCYVIDETCIKSEKWHKYQRKGLTKIKRPRL